MENDNRNRNDSVFSRKIRAGRRRTYFFDVRTTRGNDYYLTITESKKRFDGNGYERHKIFLYKEDFNKFIEETTAVIDHIKSLMPDFDFDAFSHKYEDQPQGEGSHEDVSPDNHVEESADDNDHGMDDTTETNNYDQQSGGETTTHHDDDDLKL